MHLGQLGSTAGDSPPATHPHTRPHSNLPPPLTQPHHTAPPPNPAPQVQPTKTQPPTSATLTNGEAPRPLASPCIRRASSIRGRPTALLLLLVLRLATCYIASTAC